MTTHVRCGTLFAGDEKAPRGDATIGIGDDGKVAFVADTADAPPVGVHDTVLDYSGLFVMPGLLDVHTGRWDTGLLGLLEQRQGDGGDALAPPVSRALPGCAQSACAAERRTHDVDMRGFRHLVAHHTARPTTHSSTVATTVAIDERSRNGARIRGG